jgi:hypothetical protein
MLMSVVLAVLTSGAPPRSPSTKSHHIPLWLGIGFGVLAVAIIIYVLMSKRGHRGQSSS